MKNKFFAVAAFAFAFAIALSANAYTAADFGSMTLKRGAKNMYVSNMQTALNTCTGSTLVVDGNFGSGTKAAVMAFQASKSLTPDGLVGMNTKAALAACGTTTTPTTPSTPVVVSGTEGVLSTVTKLGTYNNEKVAEASKDVKVLALEVRAKDGDQKIDGLVVSFKKTTDTGTAGNNRFSRSASDISVWLDGKEIGRKATADSSDDASDKYTYRFTGMSGIVAKDTTAKIYVAVSSNSTIDSKDLDDTWSVYLDSNAISATSANGRYRDYSTSTTGIQTAFYFQSLSAGDTKYRVNKGSTSPAAQTIQGSITGETTNRLLLAIDLKAENNEMFLQRLPVTLTTSGANTPEVIKNVELKINGTPIENKSAVGANVSACTGLNAPYTGCTGLAIGTPVQTTEILTFGQDTKLNFKMDKNTTYKVEVIATLNKMTGSFTSGDTVKAEYTSANVTATTVETSVNGILIGDSISNRTGSALGDTMTVYSEGVAVSVSSKSAAAANGASTNEVAKKATATFKADLTSFNNTVYVPAAGSLAATINLVNSSTLAATAMNVSVIKTDGDTTQAIGGVAGNSYQVSGTEGFDLYAELASPAAASYYAELVNVKVYDAAGALTATIPVTGQKTNPISLN